MAPPSHADDETPSPGGYPESPGAWAGPAIAADASVVPPDLIFRIEPVRPIEVLRAEALAAQPPVEAGPFRTPDLVDLRDLDDSLTYDLRYATADNFMGTAFYRKARAYLQQPAARAVVAAHQALADEGLGLVVYDAYRPWFVTRMFWDATPAHLKQFVADPVRGSRHNRGAAVDVGLFDRSTGAVLPMPSGYDEFTERAYADYPGGTARQRAHRDLLRNVMESHGFAVYPYEWWHFDHADWRSYPILNLTFEEIG